MRGWQSPSPTRAWGIPEENLKKLFEPLFTTKAKGIGLGLALVKMLVEGQWGQALRWRARWGRGALLRCDCRQREPVKERTPDERQTPHPDR